MKRLLIYVLAVLLAGGMSRLAAAFPPEEVEGHRDAAPAFPALTAYAEPDDDDEPESSKAKDEEDDADEEEDEAPAKKEPEKKSTEKKDSAKKNDADKESKGKKKEEPKKAPVVKRLIEVKVDQYLIPARAINLPLPGKTKTVRELLERFDKWSKDEEVGAVLLNLDGVYLAMPDVEELRAGISRLKKNGKRVVAYLNSGDDMGYLLACMADEIAMSPSSAMVIQGVGRLFPFMRGLYQLRGIEYDVITAGRFKYPGFLNSREPNKYFAEEMREILDSWFDEYVRFIAEGRKLETEVVKSLIDVALFDAQDAKNRGLVDVLAYYDEYCNRVVKRTKYKKVTDGESDFSRITSLNDLLNAWNAEVKKAQKAYQEVGPKIAVLNARGPIVDVSLGAGMASSLIMRDDFVKTIEDIRKNKTIQAVVLRIDSPGGSGYASDVIWRKLRELDEEKPLIVSMGTVAGSGGYYIACPARLIYAEPTTITGSIGVLAILANQASAINRMDVNLAEMKRGERSLFGSGHRDMLPADRDYLQKFLLDFYEIFLDRVASTRKMPKDEVRKIAEGRIYTGRQAIKIGLVDRLGTLQDAIVAAREAANIPPSAEIKIINYPRPSSIGELLFEGMGVSMVDAAVRQSQSPAPSVTFDQQLQWFARRPAPLCWMAVPGLETWIAPVSPPRFPMDAQASPLEGVLPRP